MLAFAPESTSGCVLTLSPASHTSYKGKKLVEYTGSSNSFTQLSPTVSLVVHLEEKTTKFEVNWMGQRFRNPPDLHAQRIF